jgi:signal transduction histidine kinase
VSALTFARRALRAGFLPRAWRSARVRDVVTALVLTVVLVAGSYGEAHPTGPSDKFVNGHPIPYTPDAAMLLVALAALVLAVRRRYPMTVLAISASAVGAYSLLGYVNGAALIAPMVALYAVTRTVSTRQAVIIALITLVFLMSASAAANPFGPTSGGFFLIPAMAAAALFGGIATASRRAYVASIQARAEDEARRRIDEERLRIARELHDVVAHTMSTINVQASAAATVLTDRPDAAAEALQAIRTASKNGLRELRAILNVLRQADDADPTAPVPGLVQLDALVAGASQAGLATTLTVTGQVVPLPAGVDLAAYRIIQESLTNAIRHAGPATATVALTYRKGRLLIEVADTGRGVPPASAGDVGGAGHTGHGMAGMRERAAAAGGTFEAGPASGGGGFTVTVTLPFGPPGQADDGQPRGTGNGAAPSAAKRGELS